MLLKMIVRKQLIIYFTNFVRFIKEGEERCERVASCREEYTNTKH